MRAGNSASASSTFQRRAAAEAWLKRKEAEAKKPGGSDRLSRARAAGHTLSHAIDRYIAESEREIGRTKAQVLSAVKGYGIAETDCEAIGVLTQRNLLMLSC